MKNKLSTNEKRALYNARKRKGDSIKLSNELPWSNTHIVNVLAGRRENNYIIDQAYKLSYRRKENSLV
jgi:hypothetical protein